MKGEFPFSLSKKHYPNLVKSKNFKVDENSNGARKVAL